MANNIPIGMENTPSNHDQDITSKVAMLLDSSTAFVSAPGAITEPRYDEGIQIVSCEEVTEWYYLLLKSKDLKRYNEILTGKRIVYAKPTESQTAKYRFQFKTFIYTTVDHRKRLEECEYTEAEYNKRMAFAAQADDAPTTLSDDTPEQSDPIGGGFLFVNAPLKMLKMALDHIEPHRYLVKDFATGREALIPAKQMNDFICIYESMPWNFKLMNHSIADYAKNRQRVRITGGSLKGAEGYILRLHRSRHLVFSFGTMTLAIEGIHAFPFEPVT